MSLKSLHLPKGAMAFKKREMRRMYTAVTDTLKIHQNTHGYIYINQNLNESKRILKKRIKPIRKIYLMIKICIGQFVNRLSEMDIKICLINIGTLTHFKKKTYVR